MKVFQQRIKYLNSNFGHDPWMDFLELNYSLLIIRSKPMYTAYWIIKNSEILWCKYSTYGASFNITGFKRNRTVHLILQNKKKAAYTNTNLNLILRMSEQSFKHVFLCILEVVKEHIFP